MSHNNDWRVTDRNSSNDPSRVENRQSGREASVEYCGSAYARTLRDSNGNDVGTIDIRDFNN